MLTKDTVSKWDGKRVEREMRDRLGEVDALKHRNGGTFANMSPEDAGTARRLTGELNILGERADELREADGVEPIFTHYDRLLNEPEGLRDADGNRIPHPGASSGRGESIKPVASMWDAMRSAGFELGRQNRATVPAGVLWAAVTSPTDTLAPARREQIVRMGADQRYVFPALRSDPLSPLDTAVDWARQTVRALATTASMRRAIAATTTKPESAFTVALVHSALEQIAHKIAGIPNILFRNAGIRQVVDSELRLGLAEALDAQAVAIINAAGMTAGGTGSSLAARIRKAMTVVQAAGYEPNTVALSPADAEALDLELLDILNSTNTLPNWGLSVRVGKSVTTGFVFDRNAFATVHASPVEIAAFEENSGASNSQLARGEFNAITTVEQVAAGAALGAQV